MVVLSPDELHGRRFSAHGVSLALAAGPDRRVQLTVLVNDEPCQQQPIVLELASPQQMLPTDGQTPLFCHYPGKSRHPAGYEATVSWFNDAGEGCVRIISTDRLILLPLVGWEEPPEAAALPVRSSKGPARAMDLWLAVAALLDPHDISAQRLQQMTGINVATVYEFINHSAQRRLAVVPDRNGRGQRYRVTPDLVPVLAEFIRASWLDWRLGLLGGRVAANRTYFVASMGWDDLPEDARQPLIPTGVSWLEGHGAGNPGARLTKLGSIDRIQVLCRASNWERHLLTTSQSRLRSERIRAYDSEANVLPNDHPLWGIIDHREAGNVSVTWPGGMRALDALDDPEPRVRDAAKEAWMEWVNQHRVHVGAMQAGMTP